MILVFLWPWKLHSSYALVFDSDVVRVACNCRWVEWAGCGGPDFSCKRRQRSGSGGLAGGAGAPARDSSQNIGQASILKASGPAEDFAADQEARGLKDGPPKAGEKLQIATNLAEIDAALTGELEQIVTAHGWPTIALVGIDA